MILHRYSTEDESEYLEEWFELGKSPDVIEKDGKVFLRDYARARPERSTGGCWPKEETACAVLPEQKHEAERASIAAGCPTEFVVRGHEARPILKSRAHRAAYHRSVGLFDRDGGYSDAQKT